MSFANTVLNGTTFCVLMIDEYIYNRLIRANANDDIPMQYYVHNQKLANSSQLSINPRTSSFLFATASISS